jgi:hypothetical protein
VIATLGLDADIATLSLPASTTISTYGRTLVDDTDAEAALKTLLLRRIKLTIDDAGIEATGVKCTVASVWNGDADGPTDDITKGNTVGNYSLSADGSALTIEAAALTGNCTAVLAASIYSNAGGTAANVSGVMTSNDIVLTFTNTTTGAALDLSVLVDTGILYCHILYMTDA